MKKLHLSRQFFKSSDPRIDGRHPVPICGASMSEATLKRGNGIGLVSVLDYEAHCIYCIIKVKIYLDEDKNRKVKLYE